MNYCGKNKNLLTITFKLYYNKVDLSGGGKKMKRTYQPNNKKMKRHLGFFARKKGNVINSRRKKGRKTLSK